MGFRRPLPAIAYDRTLRPLRRNASHALRRWRNRRRTYRPVFVCGAMGSGTTLAAALLHQRFETAGLVEESAREIARDSALHLPRVARFPSVAALEQALLPDPSWDPAAAREALQSLYRSVSRGEADTVIDKGPNANPVRAAFLRRCYPDAHFVLVFRDPVASVEGFRRKWRTFARAPLTDAIHFYRFVYERFLEASRDFPERVVAASYEELVAATDAALERLAAPLELRPSPAARELESRPNREGRGLRNVADGRIGIVDDANRRAYARLADAEVDTIRDALGGLYERLQALPRPAGVGGVASRR